MEWGSLQVCVLGGGGEGLENEEEVGCKCRKNTSWIQTDTFIYIYRNCKKDHCYVSLFLKSQIKLC